MTIHSTRVTGNEPAEGVDPGGTRSTRPGNPDKTGPARPDKVDQGQTVVSGDRNTNGRTGDFANDVKP